MPQRHLILIFFLWLVWVKQSIIFNSILFLHYVTCSQGQHWHAGWKLVPSTSLHPLVVSISSTLLKPALLLPLLGLLKRFLLEMLCCAFPRLSCGWLSPAWQKLSAGSWAGCLNLHKDAPCSPSWIHSWSWADHGPFGNVFPPALAQVPSCFKGLLSTPAVFKIYLAAPSSFTSRLQCCVVQHECPQNTQISRKKLEEEEISNLFAGDEIFPYPAWPPCSLFLLSFFFLSWKASPFLPKLSVPRQLSQPHILTAERMAVLKSLSFVPRLPLSAFHVLLNLGNATLSLSSPAVTSFWGHSANPALPGEVRVGISCCTGNSSYSWSSLALPGAPVLGVVAAFWGIFIL